MKTILYLTAILTLGIQGILCSQEQISEGDGTKAKSALKPINKVSYDAKADDKDNVKSETIPSDQSINQVNEKISSIDRQIAELEKLKSSLKEVDPTAKVAETTNVTVQKVWAIKIDDYFTLKEEAEALNEKYVSLRSKAASLKQNNAKIKLLNEASVVYKVYEIKQIDASNMLSQINLEKFSENKTLIGTLLIDYKGGAIFIKMVNKLTDEADFVMRMAVEIREEANAQPNNSAILANYSNAEEKEGVALNKQEEAIDILEKTAFINFLKIGNDLDFNGVKLSLTKK